ncbi:MAG: hypothetical protein HUK24_05535 [Sphaerochaetaceae bacterium]|nr:hypothetical protein [Sphaerochaetaceae bacterium]
MKKNLMLLILISLVTFFSFGNPVMSFEQKNAGVIVNLADTSFNVNTSNYTENNLIGRISYIQDPGGGNGFSSGNVRITAEILSGQWCYVFQGNDTRYQRPFGIQFVAYGLKKNGSHDREALSSDNNFYIGEDTNSTKYVYSTNSLEGKYGAIYWDLVLVFKNNVNTTNDNVLGSAGTYNLVRSDKFYNAIIKITLEKLDTAGNPTETIEKTLVIHGFYDGDSGSKKSGLASDTTKVCTLSVNPTASASNINLKQAYGSGEKINVGTYNLITNSIATSTTTPATVSSVGSINIVLSSKNDPSVPSDEGFVLKHVGNNGVLDGYTSNKNTVKYNAYIISDNVNQGRNKNNTSSSEVAFDGTSIVNNNLSSGNFNSMQIVPSNYILIDGKYIYSWTNTGTIAIEIPDNQTINGQAVDVEKLVTGLYTSNIYIHVITDFK